MLWGFKSLTGLLLAFALAACGSDLKVQVTHSASKSASVEYEPGAKVIEDGKGDYAFAMLDPALVCTDTNFYNQDGELMRGTRACVKGTPSPQVDANLKPENIRFGVTIAGVVGKFKTRPENCANDGAIDCVSVDGFPALDISTFSNADIRSGVTIGGITGILTTTAPICTNDGGMGCLTDANYPAVKASTAAPKILAGQTLGGIVGTGAGRPADCASDGATDCVTVATYPAALASGGSAKILVGQTLAGLTGTTPVKPANCSGDGATDCVTVAAYPAALAAGAAAKILVGQTLAGVMGTAPVKPANCSSDGAIDCVTIAAYPAALALGAAAKILTGETLAGANGTAALTPGNCATDGGTDCVTISAYPAVDKVNKITANADKFKTSLTLLGVTGTLAACNTDGGIGCVTSASYPSVVKANVTAGVIKGGTIIAGVTGAYPNATYSLTVGDAYADIDASNFQSKVVSSSDFGWFDRNGTRRTGSGSANITAANIISGISIFGVAGSATVGSACTADGQTNCITGSPYKAVDTSSYSTWDVRIGKTVGGVTGSLAFYKNGAYLAVWNRSSGSGASSSTTVPDAYDTLDDSYDLPAGVVPGWSVATNSVWVRDSLSDIDANGACNGTEDCVYKDSVTGQLWSKAFAASTWENSIASCISLNYGGYSSGWRLPTQKELIQSYIDGAAIMNNVLGAGLTNSYLVSATSRSTQPANYMNVIQWFQGFGSSDSKFTLPNWAYYTCTR